MKKLFSLSVIALLVLSVMPAVFATSIGTGIGIDIETEDFEPYVWMCDGRVVADDAVQWGRYSGSDDPMIYQRNNNYAFEGESIAWRVLVMDKNGVEKIEDVFATIGDVQGYGNDIEVNCQEIPSPQTTIPENCNARILEEDLTGTDYDSDTQQYYECTLHVETPDSMYGEYWITVEALDLDGLSGTMDENEYWFLNPVIALSIDGDLVFENVRPGIHSYSDTILVGNDADDGSGVLLDMFISGTDFYDSSSSGAMCPTSNVLELNGVVGTRDDSTTVKTDIDDTGFRYFATNGAYSTYTDLEHDAGDAAKTTGTYDVTVDRYRDQEGYVNIQYGDHWDRTMYNEAEILQENPITTGATPADLGYGANMLAPGAEMALTFKLILPEPCNGDFDSGQIYFWGEAI